MTASRVKLTIASGTKNSSTLAGTTSATAAQAALGAAAAITLQVPATLTGTLTVQMTIDGVNWATLQDAAANFVPAAATICRLPLGVSAQDIRIVSASNEAADRDFWLSIQEC